MAQCHQPWSTNSPKQHQKLIKINERYSFHNALEKSLAVFQNNGQLEMLPCTGSKVIRTHLNYKTINRARTDGMACSDMSLGHFEHDDVIKWKYFPHNWPFVRGIHRSPVNSQHKGQWRGALRFSLICFWINDWVNNREAGDLRRYRAHYDVIVMDGLYTADIFLFLFFISTLDCILPLEFALHMIIRHNWKSFATTYVNGYMFTKKKSFWGSLNRIKYIRPMIILVLGLALY